MSETAQYPVYTFGGFQLDTRQGLLRKESADEPLHLKARVFDTLRYFVEHPGQLIGKAELMKAVWPDTLVDDNNLNQNISALRKLLGEKPGEHRFIVTVPGRGYRFVAEVRPLEAGRSQSGEDERPDIGATPNIRFCRTPDGVNLAYAVSGTGVPLVKTGNWLTHVEYDWDSPVFGGLFRALSERHQLLRYDQRGNGLSDWDLEGVSLDGFVTDLETVVDAAGFERFAVLGISGGCTMAIAYAVRHPERVTHLVLEGGFYKAMRSDEEADAMATLIEANWGSSNPAYRQIFTSGMMPDATIEQQNWMNEQQRVATSPENAARYMRYAHETDVSDLLPQVSVPTLVMHCRGDAIPLEVGRSMAAAIPGARFVVLEGRNHVLLPDHPATARFREELSAFLAEDQRPQHA